MTFEEEMHQLETQLADIERLASEVESADGDASDLLVGLAEGAKKVQETIERARRAAQTEAAAPPDAPAA